MPKLDRYFLVLIACIVLSIAGILFAIFVSADPADAGRGGALAVAIALYSLFASRGFGAKLYQLQAEEIPALMEKLRLPGETPPAVQPGEQISALNLRLRREANDQRVQNRTLAISTAIGTIAWGFGDIPARWALHLLGH